MPVPQKATHQALQKAREIPCLKIPNRRRPLHTKRPHPRILRPPTPMGSCKERPARPPQAQRQPQLHHLCPRHATPRPPPPDVRALIPQPQHSPPPNNHLNQRPQSHARTPHPLRVPALRTRQPDPERLRQSRCPRSSGVPVYGRAARAGHGQA